MKTQQQTSDLAKLVPSERKIYDAIMRSFPNTEHESAYNKAIEGGVNFQYVSK